MTEVKPILKTTSRAASSTPGKKTTRHRGSKRPLEPVFKQDMTKVPSKGREELREQIRAFFQEGGIAAMKDMSLNKVQSMMCPVPMRKIEKKFIYFYKLCAFHLLKHKLCDAIPAFKCGALFWIMVDHDAL